MRKSKAAVYFILPSVILLLSVSIFPLIFSLRASFMDWNLARPLETSFAGIDNFRRLFTHPGFLVALKNTALLTGVCVGLEFAIGIGIALLLAREIKGSNVFRTLLIFPMMMTPVIVGLIWLFMYYPRIGVINFFLHKLSLPTPAWTSSKSTALLSIMIPDIWQWTPFVFIVLFAGIQSGPQEVMESALVDGASNFQRFIYITLPLLKPVIMVVLLLRIIDVMKLFDTIYILTNGGPGYASENLSWFAYRTLIRAYDVGLAAASSYIILVIVVIIVTILLKVFKD